MQRKWGPTFLVLVQKVETDSALSKVVIRVQGQKFFRDLNTAEWPNPACFFFFCSGSRSVNTRTVPARPVVCAEAHGKGSTSQAEALQGKKVCSPDGAQVKQSDTNLQTNSKIGRGPLQGAKASRPAAVLLAGMEQTNVRPFGIQRL